VSESYDAELRTLRWRTRSSLVLGGLSALLATIVVGAVRLLVLGASAGVQPPSEAASLAFFLLCLLTLGVGGGSFAVGLLQLLTRPPRPRGDPALQRASQDARMASIAALLGGLPAVAVLVLVVSVATAYLATSAH